MTGDTNHGNLGRMDTRFGREASPAGRLQSIFPVNIAIADKNPMVLRALEALLTPDRRFNLLLMASDGGHFLSSLAHLPVSLGVIGWELPPLRATEILQALAKRPAPPKIVVYSGTKDTAAPAETLRLGGAGFVSKLSPPERLLEVFAAVAAGDMVFPFVDIHKVRPDPLTSLTHRERDLLAALESGQRSRIENGGTCSDGVREADVPKRANRGLRVTANWLPRKHPSRTADSCQARGVWSR
jgi:DNA-binding NarL/FixJ family response regulator